MREPVVQSELLSPPLTLGEGNTPLVPSVGIGPRQNAGDLWFKLESCNPTGSYKDRFIAAEVARMRATGVRVCLATSSGNTGSSLASYCARARIGCLIVVNDNASRGKLAQMRAHGARLVRLPGFITDPQITASVFAAIEELSRRRGVPLVVSAFRHCPAGMAEVGLLAEEIHRACRPRHVFVPVGGGGLYSAVAETFTRQAGPLPRIHAVQPEGCLTVVASFLRGDREIRPVASTTTISGLSVPSDLDASRALSLLYRCEGLGIAVRDEEIIEAQQLLLETKGIYSEPAGAASVAGWLRACGERRIDPRETAVCLITGHGFKDPNSIAVAARRHRAVRASAASATTVLENLLEQTLQ
jgi:threonine synthase